MRIMRQDLKRFGCSTGQEIEDMMRRFLIAFVIFCSGAFAFSIYATSARDESIIGATTDNLLSEEMAEFIVLYNQDELDELDMD